MTHHICELCHHNDVCKYQERYIAFVQKVDEHKKGLNTTMKATVETIPNYAEVGIMVTCKYYMPVLPTIGSNLTTKEDNDEYLQLYPMQECPVL